MTQRITRPPAQPLTISLPQPVDKGLVLYMPFQEGSGKVAADLSGKDNHGSLVNGPSWTSAAGKRGGALNFASDSGARHIVIGSKPSLDMKLFRQVATSPDVNAHQGVAADGTNIYTINNGELKKWDLSWNLQLTNSGAGGAGEANVNHIADGSVYNGKIYCAAENFTSCADFDSQRISVWNTSDLSFDSNHDISAQGMEIASLVVDGDNDIIYVVSFCDGTKIWKYKLSDWSFLGTITISSSLASIQGITKKGDMFYIVSGSKIYRVELDGTRLAFILEAINEGIDYTTNVLYALNDPGAVETVYSLVPRDGDGLSVGIWVNSEFLPSEMIGSFMRIFWTSDDKCTLFYRRDTPRLEMKFSTAARPSILEADLSKNDWQHFFFTYNAFTGTLELYRNGVLKSTKSAWVNLPAINWDWYIGSTGNSLRGALVNKAVIYNRALSADEIRRCYERGL